jgi:NitT/TauT family transport system substrate-binding protein
MLLSLVSVLSGCGLLGGSDPEAGARGCGVDGPERQVLNVSIMPTTDVAPFHLAMQEGFFEAECLTVDYVDAPSSGKSVLKLIPGDVDIAYASYKPFFLNEAKNVARDVGGIRLVADASSAGPDSCVVVAMPGSRVKNIKDMGVDGLRVAATGEDSIGVTLTQAALRDNGVKYTVEWVQTPFPATSQALTRGDVDAAFVTEPFISDTHKAGAVTIFDTAEGATANFPTAGWGSTGDFVKENPKTIAAFQRAMQKGTDLALSDRGLVEPLLVKHSKVDEQTAKVATLLTFQSKLDASRIQRVPDLMRALGEIGTEIKAEDMIVPTAPLRD